MIKGEKPSKPSTNREKLDYLKGHKLSKYGSELIWRVAGKIFLAGYMTGSGNIEHIKDMFDPEKTKGLLSGTVLGTSLVYPSTERGKLTYYQAPAGRWIAYDFRRPSEFPIAAKKGTCQQTTTGQLAAFMLDEVIKNPVDQLTPTSTLKFASSLTQALSFDTPGIETLLEVGFVRPTTTVEAFNEAGLYDDYEEDLERYSHMRDQVYLVTPKGNTLVSLLGSGGYSEPKEDPSRYLNLGPELGTA